MATPWSSVLTPVPERDPSAPPHTPHTPHTAHRYGIKETIHMVRTKRMWNRATGAYWKKHREVTIPQADIQQAFPDVPL